MKKLTVILFAFALGYSTDLILSPALTDNALSAAMNPAGLATYRQANMALVSSFRPESLLIGGLSIKGIGFGVRNVAGNATYSLADGFRINQKVYGGMRFSYVKEEEASFYNYDIGVLLRPYPFLSLGANTENLVSGGSNKKNVKLGGAVKIFELLTLGSDLDYNGNFSAPRYTLDLALGGMNLSATANVKTETYGVGLSISMAYAEAGFMYPFNKSGDKLVAVWSGMDRKQPIVEPVKKVAVVKIQGNYQDIEPEFSLLGGGNGYSLSRILAQLRNAARDEDIKMVVLDIGSLSTGLGMVEEIRQAIMDLRLSGKRTVAYLDNVELMEYYLASAADQIVVEPMAAWVMAGISAEVTFLKGTMDKIGVKAEFERIGEYKSAVEPLTLDSMSPAFKENESALLSSIYEQLLNAIATARSMTRDSVEMVIDKGNISLKEAVEKGFINKTGYLNEILAEYAGDSEKGVDLSNRSYYSEQWSRNPRIAILNATGTIVTGESFTDFFSGEVFMGSETMSRILKQFRKDKNIKAVVLRINSGGGSGVASDIIWYEVKKLRESGKPVIVSIGDVAASGGYYIACAADTILCSEGSIVGSIGVFAGKFVLRGLYDKIGITKEIIKFGKNADAFSDYQEFTPEQRTLLAGSIKEFYDGFLDRVAEGRGMTTDSVNVIGRGRVFTGSQALERGLVDEIGGIGDAIDIAKIKAGFGEDENPEIDVYPKERGFFSTMTEGEEAKMSRSFIKALSSLNDQKVLAIMPYRISIK